MAGSSIAFPQIEAVKPRRLSLTLAAILGSCITAAAIIWVWFTTGTARNGLFLVCPGIAFTAMLALGSDDVAARLRSWIGAKRVRIAVAPAALWFLYAVYAVGMKIATLPAMTAMAIYLAVPFLILPPPSTTKTLRWLEPVVILWLWLPLEFGLIRGLLILTGRPDFHYAFAQLLAIDAGIIAFVVWRGVPGVGFCFEYSAVIARNGLVNFLMFAAIGIPLGILIGFIRLQFTILKLAVAPALFAGIFFFTALPEEFLFRGMIQNWIERMTQNRSGSLIIAAIIFGASHLNNSVPAPNYRYFLMATIAGIFYGRAWRNTRSLMASSITHALVDSCWTVFFR